SDELLREKDFYSQKAWREWETQEQTRHIYAAARARMRRLGSVGLRSATNAVALQFFDPPPPLFWVALKSESSAERPSHYIESPPRLEPMFKEPEPPPLTPAWSNAMQEEIRERSQRIIKDFNTRGLGRLIAEERWLLVRTAEGPVSTFLCRNALAAADVIGAVIKRVRKPEYFDASVRVAGETVISSNTLQVLEHVVGSKGSGQFWKRNNPGQPPSVLASATHVEDGQTM